MEANIIQDSGIASGGSITVGAIGASGAITDGVIIGDTEIIL